MEILVELNTDQEPAAVRYQTVAMLIDELVSHNKPFSLMAYPNRTHAIRERKNTTRHMRELMTRFLLENLPVESAVGNPTGKDE